MAEQKTGRRIIMNDGTTWEDSECGYADGFLWLYLHGVQLSDAFPIVNDPNATKKIIFEYGEMSDKYTGFKKLQTIRNEDYGCSVCLTK